MTHESFPGSVSSSAQIGGIEDVIAADRLHATVQAYDLITRAQQIRSSIVEPNYKNPMAAVVFFAGPLGFIHPQVFHSAANGIQKLRAQRLETAAERIMPYVDMSA